MICESAELTSFTEVGLGSSERLVTVIDVLQVAGVFFMPGMQEKVVSLIGLKCNCRRKVLLRRDVSKNNNKLQTTTNYYRNTHNNK